MDRPLAESGKAVGSSLIHERTLASGPKGGSRRAPEIRDRNFLKVEHRCRKLLKSLRIKLRIGDISKLDIRRAPGVSAR